MIGSARSSQRAKATARWEVLITVMGLLGAGAICTWALGNYHGWFHRITERPPTKASIVHLPATQKPQAAPRVNWKEAVDQLSLQPKTWRTIKSWMGRGAKDTALFYVTTPEWRIKWEAKDTSADTNGMFSVIVFDEAGRLVSMAGNIIGSGEDIGYVHSKPWTRYYLTISGANNRWKVTAEERK